MTAQGIAAAIAAKTRSWLCPLGQKPGPEDAPEPLQLPRHWIAPDDDKYGIGQRLIARKQSRLNGMIPVNAYERRRG